MPTVAPYGSWRSPIAPELLVASAVRLSSVVVAGDDVYWNEGRPSEQGRQVVVRRRAGGEIVDVTPAGFSARTVAHEYGGRSFDVRSQTLVFSNFADQRLCLGDGTYLTPPAEELGMASVRYADHHLAPDASSVVCVREMHPPGASPAEVTNDLVVVRLADGEVSTVARGRDFYLAPRWSPDGRRIAWLSWDHPNMPWDGTELWVADQDGGEASLVAGGRSVSVSQPRWSPSGVLHWVSDESGWWRISRSDGVAVPFEESSEYAGPDWVFGQSTYAFLDDSTLVSAPVQAGFRRLEGLASSPESYTAFDSLAAAGDAVVCLAASPRSATAVVRVERDGTVQVLRESQPRLVDSAFVSVPVAIEFPSGDGVARGLLYRPSHPDAVGPPGERPPLIVLSHGGPTSATSSALNLAVQFWTSRGVAVVDVDYGGSTGYGRDYRERLRGQWGVVDVDDCVAAARWLTERDEVDGRKLVIRGGSAGGYTTLAALTFRPGVFAAGISLYGIADAEALARDTHKFESRYLDGLIGPYPAAREVYRSRSPIHATDRLSCPLLLFQGLEDEVVPPSQSQAMARALDIKGIPHAYVGFEGEQHGFRKAETIIAVARAELAFLGRVLGFAPADDLPPVPIVHESALGSERGGGGGRTHNLRLKRPSR